jgi:hypothetical protein
VKEYTGSPLGGMTVNVEVLGDKLLFSDAYPALEKGNKNAEVDLAMVEDKDKWVKLPFKLTGNNDVDKATLKEHAVVMTAVAEFAREKAEEKKKVAEKDMADPDKAKDIGFKLADFFAEATGDTPYSGLAVRGLGRRNVGITG